MTLGFFQIENLIFNRTEFALLDLRETESEMPWCGCGEARQVWQDFWARAKEVDAQHLLDVVQQLAPSRHEPIVLVCETGVKSVPAQQRLEKIGYINVFAISGGALGLLAEASNEQVGAKV